MVSNSSGFDDIWAQVSQVELSLMREKPVIVFGIPPMSSAKGHMSAEWRGKQMWKGLCKVVHAPDQHLCKIMLVNEDSTLYAQSLLRDGSTYETHVTRAADSVRAFALTLVSDAGQRATVGI